MANVTGPTRNLPGSYRTSPKGVMCDMEGHESISAIYRVVTEVDSMGAEEEDLCEECFQKSRAAIIEDRNKPKPCDMCNQSSTTVLPWRDPEEGTCGPVYQVCSTCRRNAHERFCEDFD